MILRPIMSFFGTIFSILTLGLAMGALTVGAIFYMYGRDLPSHEVLAQYTPRTISRIYSGEGNVIDEFAVERRLFTPAEEIPDLVKQAFISAEDKNFYIHEGYDLRGMAAAFVEAVRSRGENLRGASTITQQVMKNFLLSSDRSAERKIREIILAARMEQVLDKEHILELYLNEIDLGVRSFGVTAAARSYFNKTLDELTPAEAAFLAVHPKAPYSYHPVRDREDAIERRNFILEEMFENGYLNVDQYQIAVADPLRTVQNGDFPSYQSTLPPRDYFTDEIRRQMTRQFGLDNQEFSGEGYAIRATINPDLQTSAREALQRALRDYDRSQGRWRGTGVTVDADTLVDEATWRDALSDAAVPRNITYLDHWIPAVVLDVKDQQLVLGIEGIATDDPRGNTLPRSDTGWFSGNLFDNFNAGDVILVRQRTEGGAFVRWSLEQVPEVQGGFMAMDVNTGRVLAMQGGFAYAHSVFNRTTQARRQPGSAFKPFVYAAALDSGYTPATIVVDAPIEVRAGGEIWRPQNASHQYYGPTPVRTGIEQSRNLMTVRLAQEVGMDVIAGYAERFGVYDRMNQFLSASLGSEETTLFRIVAAYAMFANGGERVEPTLVDRVQDRNGATIYRHDQRQCLDCNMTALAEGRAPNVSSDRERVMNAITAYQLTSMLEGVVQRGTASRTVNLSVPIAGKTGTTNDAKDVWFVGFSSNIVAGCYIGFDVPRSMGRGASGGGMCGPVFNAFMQDAIRTHGGGQFRVPDECQFIKIDRFTGARLPDAASGENVVSECFRQGEEPLFGITFDGGFAMAGDLPLFEEARRNVTQTTNSSGGTATIGPRATLGTLSSGGLY